MIDFLKWIRARKTAPPPRNYIFVGSEFSAQLESLNPGETLVIKISNGNTFAVLPSDDLEHLLSQIGMHLRNTK